MLPEEWMGTHFDYHPLVLNAALRMELGLIARGFRLHEVEVSTGPTKLIFSARAADRHHTWGRRHPRFTTYVSTMNLDAPVRAEAALDRAVFRFLEQSAIWHERRVERLQRNGGIIV
jgi:hypothetical protein